MAKSTSIGQLFTRYDDLLLIFYLNDQGQGHILFQMVDFRVHISSFISNEHPSTNCFVSYCDLCVHVYLQNDLDGLLLYIEGQGYSCFTVDYREICLHVKTHWEQ